MTPQEKIAIFHAYNGAMVKTEKGAAPFHIMTQDMVCVRYNSTDLGDWHLISDCQLLLTDLSLISDEHAVEVAKIMGVIDTDCGIEDYEYWGNYVKKSYLNEGKSHRTFTISVEVIDYLRS